MLQSYYGNGKGKTSAAVGAAVRAVGGGMNVLFVQFFKNGDSSEIAVLDSLENLDVLIPKDNYVLFEPFNKERIAARSKEYSNLIFKTVFLKAEKYQMIILDEVLDAVHLGLVDETEFSDFVATLKTCKEIVLTGHSLPEKIASLSDYVSEIQEIKHPFNLGAEPRKGIEY